VLYAPFVKASDKVKKDVADLSLSDFQPKRFALNYDPPMIILEYLVPSTGKLYHHKMKLRRLTGSSTVPEAIKYLQKRHPLYFIDGKIRAD
jgi:centrosomal protein CEP19